LIVNNDIDTAGGTAGEITLGVWGNYVGVPGGEGGAYVSGNRIRKFHERAIGFRGAGRRSFVEGSRVATATVAASNNLQPIIVIGPSASYSHLIARNPIHVEWATGSAAGIAVRALPQIGAEIAHTIVVDNDVNMDAPEGTVFDDRSAGIEISG